MENGPTASGDSNLPRSLTDADFHAFSLEVAQARVEAQEEEASREKSRPSGPELEALTDWLDEGFFPQQGKTGWPVDPGHDERTAASAKSIRQQHAAAEDFAPIHCNLSLAELMEHALLRAEGVLSDRGALCIKTLPYSGTTANSYYRVLPGLTPEAALQQTQSQRAKLLTPGLQPAPMDELTFWALYQQALDYSEDKALYQCDGQVSQTTKGEAAERPATVKRSGQATEIRIICELASQAIMARHWLHPVAEEAEDPTSALAQVASMTHQADSQSKASTPAKGEQQSKSQQSKSQQSKSQQPKSQQPKSQQPKSQQPKSQQPKSQQPKSQQPLATSIAKQPRLTVIALNGLKGEPCVEPLLETEVFVAIHPGQRLALVGGSRHGGDLWGAINALLAAVWNRPSSQELLLQDAVYFCGAEAPATVFLGAAGSGKQTLAAGLGHRWQRGPVVWETSDQPGHQSGQKSQSQGLKPLLAGGYGNISGLNRQDYLHQQLSFGAVLENVPLQATSSQPIFNDLGSTIPFFGAWKNELLPHEPSQAWRGSIDPNHSPAEQAPRHQTSPQKVFLLVADTTGVLPALARLTQAQALYYFALGYGADLPGWSRHQLHSTAHFKAMDRQRAVQDCLGWQACLQSRPDTEIYLVNTGWLGSEVTEASPLPKLPRESLQQRIPVSISQALVQAALAGQLPLPDAPTSARPASKIPASKMPTSQAQAVSPPCIDPVFGWALPLGLQQLPGRWCQPWKVWPDSQQWHDAAIALAQQFQTQMAALVAAGLPEAIAQAGPELPSSPSKNSADLNSPTEPRQAP